MPLPEIGKKASASPDINLFVLATGRLPRIGDDVPPWQYRGWLLYYVQLADSHPKLPGRWNHFLRTLEEGKLLDEPIPQLRFDCTPSDAGTRMIRKCLDLMVRSGSPWSAFQGFIDWLGWGLAVSSEMPLLDEDTHQALYRTFNLEPLLLGPHDYLGAILAEQRSGGWNPHAFFPTPHSVAELMAQMVFSEARGGEGRDPRLMRVMEPALGTGRMLLHASNYSYCLYGCDIDPLVIAISRINAALYAPWMAFPLPESILGISVPPPPPALLPVPEEYRPEEGSTVFRCDDHGQGLLFQ